jgi:predicted acetyltransferase
MNRADFDRCAPVVTLAEASKLQEVIAQKLLAADPACGFSHTRSDALGEDERCYVILVGQEVVGFYSYRWVSNQIYYFFIAQRWREKGIGKLALKQWFESLREQGEQHVIVNQQPGSEGFWNRALTGFDVQSERGSRVRVSFRVHT